MSAMRKRISIACDKCSRNRTKCDGNLPCRRCHEYHQECTYLRPFQKRGRPRVARERGTPSPREVVLTPQDSGLSFPTHNSQSEDYSPTALDGRPNYQVLDAGHNPNVGKNGGASSAFTNESHSTLHRGRGQHEEQESVLVSNGWQDDFSHDRRHINHEHFSGSQLRNGLPGTISKEVEKNHYRALVDLEPLLHGFLELDLASSLLDLYFCQSDGSFFGIASPFVLSPVIRQQSVIRTEQTRYISPALVVTILWAITHTASTPELLRPGRRNELLSKLQDLSLSLYHDQDLDHWHRIGGFLVKKDYYTGRQGLDHHQNDVRIPVQDVDDLLTLILLTIVTSAGDFKHDALRWHNKAIRLAKSLGLNRLDICTCVGGLSNCYPEICVRATVIPSEPSLQEIERKEELRRAFWLLFALDRHLALSWNGDVAIADEDCLVFSPLPELTWLNIDARPFSELPERTYGTPVTISGVGFFEYFLPLMTILGDVVITHRRAAHPRFGCIDSQPSELIIESNLEGCLKSLDVLAKTLHSRTDCLSCAGTAGYDECSATLITAHNISSFLANGLENVEHPQERMTLLVVLYSRFIIHVLHVLLHGKWDAISLLTPEANDSNLRSPEHMPWNHPQRSHIGEWIASQEFATCASHAITASDAIADILVADPELNFMPYLFGIYLLHGSFILLLFADRLPHVGDGRNKSVERACETIIRAHEVSVVTLPTEFQKHFRKVLRATLYSVRQKRLLPSNAAQKQMETTSSALSSHYPPHTNQSMKTPDMLKARQELFELYRWTNGSCGLAAL